MAQIKLSDVMADFLKAYRPASGPEGGKAET